MPDSFRSEVAFAFEGISGREIIGDFGLVMNGASGDELDRYDTERGSPADALLLARSTGHSQHYLLCSEDVRMVSATLAGTNNELVRSDIVLSNRPEGGAVFSVGSICFSGSLSHNGYDNNVARLATNVLREFMRR
jgi:N,N-dimethylformamidase